MESTVGVNTDPTDEPDRPNAQAGPSSTIQAAPAWRGLSPRAVLVWRIRTSVGAAVALGVLWSAILATHAFVRSPRAELATLGWFPTTGQLTAAGSTVTAVIALVWLIRVLAAGRRYRRWRWQVSDDRLIVEHGWWRQRRIRVPVDDVHTLDVKAGPLLRRWGVHRARVFASGPIGSVTIPVLADNAVAALRRDLGFDEHRFDEHGSDER